MDHQEKPRKHTFTEEMVESTRVIGDEIGTREWRALRIAYSAATRSVPIGRNPGRLAGWLGRRASDRDVHLPWSDVVEEEEVEVEVEVAREGRRRRCEL